MDNTGSFGSAIGGMSPELQAAISRRGSQGGGATSQVSNAATTVNQATQPSQPLPQPQGSPAGGLGNSAMPMNTPEANIIIKALDGRLKALSKLAHMTSGNKGA